MRHEPRRYDQLEGRSLHEEIEHLEASIIREESPAIYEKFELDRTYASRIDLHIEVEGPNRPGT